jgi:rhodanese-related sulfurtransferase
MINEITVQDLKNWQESGKPYQLIDVREIAEFAVNMGGENIPLGEIIAKRTEIADDRTVIMQCRSGMRSMNAIIALQQYFPGEYDHLVNLKGGILAWKAAYQPELNVQ